MGAQFKKKFTVVNFFLSNSNTALLCFFPYLLPITSLAILSGQNILRKRKPKWMTPLSLSVLKTCGWFHLLPKNQKHQWLYFFVQEEIFLNFKKWKKWKCSCSVVLTLCDPMDYITHQAPQSMEFSRQEYWSGLPFHSPGDCPYPGIKPRSPALQADSLPSEPPRKPILKNNTS